MSDEVYLTLVDLLTMEKDWTIHKIISGSTSEKSQRVQLEDLFLYVADHHDDEKAIKYWRYLKHCLHDIELLQFTKNDEHPKTVHSSIVLPSTAETREAESRAQANCAEKAIGLWKKIPRSKVGKLWTGTSGKEYVNENFPTLLETKKALLIEIANRWRDTKNEQEADELFEFFIFLKLQHGENKLLIDAIRKATDSHFPVKRLSRCLAHLVFPPSEGGSIGSSFRIEFEKILAIAWARNMDFKDLANIVRATRPLFGASDNVFDLLEHYSYEIAPLREAVLRLLVSMKGEIHGDLRQIYGDIEVFYPSEKYAVITITKEVKKGTLYSFEESDCHSQFETAREHVLIWLNEFPNYSICLELSIKNEYDGRRLFFRKQILSK